MSDIYNQGKFFVYKLCVYIKGIRSRLALIWIRAKSTS